MKPGPQPAVIAARLLRWFGRHGRHDLPWQRNPTPYRVWISEVMLQQTQVETVIPYFERFMRRFPDIATLAAARQDEVLHLWSGLGYYARGRNLHRAAQIVVAPHGGRLPETLPELMALPGIGRSTAGAILALAHGQRHPILDGNVKRVLARVFLVREEPWTPAGSARLWQLALDCTPGLRVAEYTQAIMDLGATVCTRTQPDCRHCPLRRECGALAAGAVEELPARRIRKARRLRRTHMILVVQDGRVLLRQRPEQGIWGGLWAPPEFEDARSARNWCAKEFSTRPLRRLPALRHSFTHFALDIEPQVLDLGTRRRAPGAAPGSVWYRCDQPQSIGLPAPVAELIRQSLAAGSGGKRKSGHGENGAVRAARTRGGGPRPPAVPG